MSEPVDLAQERLIRIERKLDALSDRLETVEDRLSSIEQQLVLLAQSVANIQTLFMRFDRRLRKLEEPV